jgi:wyosine [tRNA(Phe)-imidazoG37] synthetase (radical SAM superfamily)
MKLDTGTEAGFRRINRPLGGLTLETVVEGLRLLADVTIQTLLVDGPDGNLDAREMDAWLARVAAIRPRAVQLYTLDRPVPSDRIEAATRERLHAVGERVSALGVPAQVF